MDYVNFGKTGLRVSRLCLGAMSYGSSAWRPWVLDEEPARPFIRRAIELGLISSTPPTCIQQGPASKSWGGL